MKKLLPGLILLLLLAGPGWLFFPAQVTSPTPAAAAKIKIKEPLPTAASSVSGQSVEAPKVAPVSAGAKPEPQAASPAIEAQGPGDMFNTPSLTDLGTVEFEDGVPVKFNLNNGGSCEIRPTVLEGGQLQLVFILVVQNPDTGKIEAASPTITTLPGSPVRIGISGLSIAVTPTLKGE